LHAFCILDLPLGPQGFGTHGFTGLDVTTSALGGGIGEQPIKGSPV